MNGHRLSLERMAFLVATLASALVYWIAPYPPMVDLPQHAGQIALLKSLLAGDNLWARDFQINVLTPYWGGYGLGLALASIMPIVAAVKLMLSLSVLGFAGLGVLARRRLGGDPRLDWLLLPGLFGFAAHWGFLTFLVAAPLVFAWLILLVAFPVDSLTRALLVLAGGVAIFFSHGLLFVFAVAVGGLTTLASVRTLRTASIGLAPFGLLAALALAYALLPRELGAPLQVQKAIIWDLTSRRFSELAGCVWGTSTGWVETLLIVAIVSSPFALGLPFSRKPAAWCPLIIVLAIWFFMPFEALNSAALYQRFALFVLPFFALIFAQAPARGGLAPRAIALGLGLIVFGQIGLEARRHWLFATETSDFAPVAAKIPPKQRVFALVFDQHVPSSGPDPVLDHFAVWYQAEMAGLVDWNFALLITQVVRYRRDAIPALPEFDADNWKEGHPEIYQYFLMRGPPDRKARVLAAVKCKLVKTAAVGTWSLFRNDGCAL